jgi:hypothetical protein
MKVEMDSKETATIEESLFPYVRSIVREQTDFPWHRDERKVVTATLAASSQALAIDFFATIRKLASRDAIFESWMTRLGIAFHGPWTIELEHILDAKILGEPRSTQVDAVATSRSGVIAFECKFTEPDGGGCSQPKPLRKGAHKGMVQCNGNYQEQVNPVNNIRSRCALSGKGIKYWDLIPQVMDLDPEENMSPCPLAGGWYQWMRNLLAALELGRRQGVHGVVVVVYVEGPFPMAAKVKGPEWAQLTDAVAGRAVPLRAVSYQELLGLASRAASPGDRAILEELATWISRLIDLVIAKPNALRIHARSS